MRLIDADALNYSTHTECAGHGDYYDIEIITKSKIDNAPTIDAVEVVRCKDCIHAEKMKPRLAGKVVVFCYLHKRERFVLADGYCESGERREP